MSGVFTGVDYDGDHRKVVFQRSQDVEPLIEHLATLRNETTGKSESGELYHVGDLPMVVVEQYLNENGVTFHDFMRDDVHIKRIMQNPDFAKFRVWTGRF